MEIWREIRCLVDPLRQLEPTRTSTQKPVDRPIDPGLTRSYRSERVDRESTHNRPRYPPDLGHPEEKVVRWTRTSVPSTRVKFPRLLCCHDVLLETLTTWQRRWRKTYARDLFRVRKSLSSVPPTRHREYLSQCIVPTPRSLLTSHQFTSDGTTEEVVGQSIYSVTRLSISRKRGVRTGHFLNGRVVSGTLLTHEVRETEEREETEEIRARTGTGGDREKGS